MHGWRRFAAAVALSAAPAIALAADVAFTGPTIGGIAVEFVLFAITLASVALFHRHTMPIAVGGAAVIAAYKIVASPFRTGAGFGGFFVHLGHEWVVLANLFMLLLGFGLLARYFEESRVPAILPKYLPDDWKGGFVLLVLVFVLSGFLDNIAAAMIGGAVAATVFRGKVHVGYLAGIVAASNAGGAGSVVGDTTTTMMWISGIPPREVLEAYIAAIVALLIFGVVAARQQHALQPIQKDAEAGARVDWWSLGVVAFILVSAITVNVAVNLFWNSVADALPVHRRRRVGRDLHRRPRTSPGLAARAGLDEGNDLSAVAGACRFDDAGGGTAVALVADCARPRFRVGRLRQHSADRARDQAGRLRLGLSCLRRGLRRLDAVVRLIGRRGAFEHVLAGALGGAVGPARLARSRSRTSSGISSCLA